MVPYHKAGVFRHRHGPLRAFLDRSGKETFQVNTPESRWRPSKNVVRIAQAILNDSGLYMAEHVKLLSEEIVRLADAAPSETGTKISAEQLAEVKDQCELGLQVEHDCPAMFALAAIYADLFTNAEPETATKISPWISVTDRQPEKDGTYLTIKRGDALAEAGTTPFHEGEWIWGDGGIIRKTDPDLQVEWWMPVPSLPERGQSK